MSTLYKAAEKYLKNGIKVVATDGQKFPIHKWKYLQSLEDNGKSVLPYFNSTNAKGIAVICGACSGNLEIIDFDTKYDLSGNLFENYMSALKEQAPDLANKLFIVETPSLGKHLYHRCEVIEGNQEFAKRPVTEEELKANPNETYKVLIESRGEGGYAQAPPMKGYRILQGKQIPVISIEEREILLDLARSFHLVVEEAPKTKNVKVNIDGFCKTPWEDYNSRGVEDMLDRLQKHGWSVVAHKGEKVVFKRPGDTKSKTSGDFSYKHNLFTVFTTSSQFTAQKGYKPAAVYAMLEHKGDFSAAAKSLINLGYGEKKRRFDPKIEKAVYQQKKAGRSEDDIKQYIQSTFDKFPEEADNIMNEINKQWGEDISTFWTIERKEEGTKIILLQRKFIEFLHEYGGFGLYYYDESSTSYKIVRVVSNLVEEASTEQMIKFVMSYIDSLPDFFDGGLSPEKLSEAVTRQINSLFSDKILQILPRLQLNFLSDTQERAYVPFKNGIVSISPTSIDLLPYKDFDKVIWKKQIKPFEIVLSPGQDPKKCEYYQYIEKISGDDNKRIQYCLSLIGYLLHGFKDPSRPFAVILAEETERDTEGGGTGKGLFWKGLQYILSCVPIDGKNFDIDKNFAFQRVSLDTQLIVIDDCKKNLDFEKFNSLITEGITVEKKNKDELFIPYRDSPKFLLTTNYTVNLKGNHGKRRSKVFEVAPFFGPNKSAKDYFGRLLFDDWDDGEWNRFYNLMFTCLFQYITSGIPSINVSEKLKKRSIQEHFGDEFAEEWEFLKDSLNNWIHFHDLYEQFRASNDFDRKDFSEKRFKKAMETAAEAYGWKLETKRDVDQKRRIMVKLVKPEIEATRLTQSRLDFKGNRVHA